MSVQPLNSIILLFKPEISDRTETMSAHGECLWVQAFIGRDSVSTLSPRASISPPLWSLRLQQWELINPLLYFISCSIETLHLEERRAFRCRAVCSGSHGPRGRERQKERERERHRKESWTPEHKGGITSRVKARHLLSRLYRVGLYTAPFSWEGMLQVPLLIDVCFQQF